jgi:hypothetical protein
VTRALVSLAAVLLLAGGCVQAGTTAKPSGQQADRRVGRGDEGAVRDKVRQCWYVDSKIVSERPVRIRVKRMNPDGTISPGAISVLDNGGSPEAARSAVRAILNPACQPWPRPSGGWPVDSFILVFDPREMF